MISIIIPAFNSKKTIIKTLLNVLKQTVKAKFEIIIVDDGSTDGTEEAVNKFFVTLRSGNITGKPGLQTPMNFYYIKQKNQGASAARNRGFKEATGEYILFLDSDVIMKPQMLEKMISALEGNRQAAFAYSSYKWGWKTFKLWVYNPDKLKQMPYVNTNSLIKRAVLLENPWDESLSRFQDWDLFLSLLERDHSGCWIPEILFKIIPKKSGISAWLPKFFYRLPIKTKRVKQYEQAKEVIKRKHGL